MEEVRPGTEMAPESAQGRAAREGGGMVGREGNVHANTAGVTD